MSGVEAAGLVLGALPLIIAALEHYAQGVSILKRLRRFHHELRGVIGQLRTEFLIFTNTCEILLQGIVRDNDLMCRLLEDPGGELWSDSNLDARLKERLRGAHEDYLETVSHMKQVMEEFETRLRLDKDGEVSDRMLRRLRSIVADLESSL